ncbi:MAG: ribose-phosphate pyrophosphokinase [Paracoccaceae bacterium]|nr:ribose-phosphate pyrophosphokinase [Paracoccaceae bacterium]MDE3237934.1 ribose-phosphate pyrophosphokinase [Paracoccaceae bacterium]
MRFFALNSSRDLGRALAQAGGFTVSPHEERAFEGGEHKGRPLVSVRRQDVYVLSSLNGDADLSANDKLCRLLFFIQTCRDHGARRVTAVVPYMAYARKDRRTKPRDPVTIRYVAQLFEAMGTDCVVTLDIHNLQSFQNAFRIWSINLDTQALFSAEIAARAAGSVPVIFSPDSGGVKRAALLRDAMAAAGGIAPGFGFMEKYRSGGVISGDLFAGEVEGRQVFIVDDMIVGGDTMLRAAEAVRAHGAAGVHLLATHALMGKAAAEKLAAARLDSITVTDAAGVDGEAARVLGSRLKIASVATLLGRVISRLDLDQPIGPLLSADCITAAGGTSCKKIQ